jgi:hypothetical protein
MSRILTEQQWREWAAWASGLDERATDEEIRAEIEEAVDERARWELWARRRLPDERGEGRALREALSAPTPSPVPPSNTSRS